MPVKKRNSKARMTPEEEAEFWADFWAGGSFLLAGWHHALGVGPVTGPEDWREVERSPEVREAARDAWHRLGADYLAGRIGWADDGRGGRGAWALAEFGEPSHAG